MSFIKKLFRTNKEPDPLPNAKKKEKVSFLTWLCSSKPQPEYEETHLTPISQDSALQKSFVSTSVNNQSKILNKLSFAHDRKEFEDEELKGQLINIYETQIQAIEDLLGPNGLYGLADRNANINLDYDDDLGVWLSIGRNEEINSLAHIKPYYFDKIFLSYDELDPEYTIEDILKSRQNIYLKLHRKSSIQNVIDSYEKEFKTEFCFKLMSECFNKLKITVYRTVKNDVWLQFNEQVEPSLYINEFLSELGFDQEHEEYEKLRQEISSGLTLQEYIDIIEHKEKLQSKYEGQNVAEYIKAKFLEKISRKGITPRNDSPRTPEKQEENNTQKEEEECHQYVLSMTANTLPKQRNEEPYQNGQMTSREGKNDKNSYEEEIFEFNVYKDDKEQEAKRIAISKERKKRSRSEDITLNDLNCAELDDNDFFDKMD